MRRKALPKELKLRILYASSFYCVVCQAQGCQIHHIDMDHSNDEEDNLVCICTKHHDEAHTKRDLSQNLTPEALQYAKQAWNSEVASTRQTKASVSGQIATSGDPTLALMGITWGYINHRRVIQMADVSSLGPSEREILELCVSRGIVDQFGIAIAPTSGPPAQTYLGNTVYDGYPHGDDQRLHRLYVALLDHLSRTLTPVHLEREWWTRARVRDLLRPGSLFFTQTGFYFNPVSETTENEHRRVHTTRRKVMIEFFVDTRDMFGTTSMTVSFYGHQSCGALLQVKSMDEAEGGELLLSCTPIGLGVGFGNQWT